MQLKRTLTAVAVDSCRDYFLERLEQLKELDLDHDGQKDVDQLAGILSLVSEKIKVAAESTDFPKLAAGVDQMMTGAGMAGSSFDRQKWSEACAEMVSAAGQVGKLLQLGIAEVKRQEKRS